MNIGEGRRAAAEALTGCERLVAQLTASRTAVAARLADERTAEPSPIEWDALYAFQMKFALLQDLASRRLIRALLLLSGEEVTEYSARAAADWCAERGWLSGGDDWLELTLIRNSLTHDYPLDIGQYLFRIADAWRRTDLLLGNIDTLTRALGALGVTPCR